MNRSYNFIIRIFIVNSVFKLFKYCKYKKLHSAHDGHNIQPVTYPKTLLVGWQAADLVTVWLDNTENVNDETEDYMKNVELTPVTPNAQADPRNPISSL